MGNQVGMNHNGAASMPSGSVVVLPNSPAAPGIARAQLAEASAGLSSQVRDDALVLVSELVTNAVQYGSPDIELRVRVVPPEIVVSVTDSGDGLPRPTERPELSANSGRGLMIVNALATHWGVVENDPPPGKSVWFDLTDV
jgi:anti-sigma regulatory factor (Ser/Thr protein kinase)